MESTEIGLAFWRDYVIVAVRRADAGDPELLDLAARALLESDRAAQVLRFKTAGVGLLEMAHLVEPRTEDIDAS